MILLFLDLSESTYWTHWSWWTLSCENPCNDGTRSRTRQCEPTSGAKYGGINNCTNLAEETEDCSANLKPGKYSPISEHYI